VLSGRASGAGAEPPAPPLLVRDAAALAARKARAILEYLDFQAFEEIFTRGALAAAARGRSGRPRDRCRAMNAHSRRTGSRMPGSTYRRDTPRCFGGSASGA